MSVKAGVECSVRVLQLQQLDFSLGLSDQICLESMFMCHCETTLPLSIYINSLSICILYRRYRLTDHYGGKLHIKRASLK